MDERALILNAIKKKKEHTPTPEVDFNFPEPDVLDKWAKKKKRQESFRGKSVEDWTNTDFLRYLDFMLKDFGASRVKENVRRDSDRINHLHDQIAKRLISATMSNSILKEYLEWWCSIWAPRLTGGEFHLNLLRQDYQVNRFTNRYNAQRETIAAPPVEPKVESSASLDVNDEDIYDLGGASLLLMKRGIVICHRILKQRGVTNPDQVMKETLEHFNKEVLMKVMIITLQHSPYPMADKVDFISIASSVLNQHGLSEYSLLSYEAHFRG